MKKKILVVEDEDDLRVLMQELLELEGYIVDVACDGQDGLDRLDAYVDDALPDLILLDLVMPVKDGFAFRAEQVGNPRLAGIPVIVVSADAHIEEKRLAMGVTAAMRKPLDFERFIEMLSRATNASRA